jgi:AcrR family transcriptional regulator
MAMTSTRAAGGRPRSPEVDSAILDTALVLYAEGGLAAVNFEQIAKRSGVSRTAIYRRWRSREELVAYALGRYREASERAFADWNSRSIDEVMDWLVANGPRVMLEPLNDSLLRHTMALGPESLQLKCTYWDVFLRPRRAAFTAMIRRARAEGKLEDGPDPEILQDMLTGALFHRLLVDPAEKSETALRDYIERVLQVLGLRPIDADGR